MKCPVLSRLSVVSLLTLLSSGSAHASAPLTYVMTVDGAQSSVNVTLQNDKIFSNSKGTQVTIQSPYLESPNIDEDLPLIADAETLQKICMLVTGGKLIEYKTASSEHLTALDTAAFTAEGTIVSDAQKHGIDPSGRADVVISTMICAKN